MTFKDITCFYWRQKGYCRKEENCIYAHHDTGKYANEPGRFHEAKPGKLATKEVTCFYWGRDGFCQKSDEECIYAHFQTGRSAGEPGRPRVAPLASRTYLHQDWRAAAARSSDNAVTRDDVNAGFQNAFPQQSVAGDCFPSAPQQMRALASDNIGLNPAPAASAYHAAPRAIHPADEDAMVSQFLEDLSNELEASSYHSSVKSPHQIMDSTTAEDEGISANLNQYSSMPLPLAQPNRTNFANRQLEHSNSQQMMNSVDRMAPSGAAPRILSEVRKDVVIGAMGKALGSSFNQSIRIHSKLHHIECILAETTEELFNITNSIGGPSRGEVDVDKLKKLVKTYSRLELEIKKLREDGTTVLDTAVTGLRWAGLDVQGI